MTITCGDCLDEMRAMKSNSTDAIVCDPPYALTANKKGGSGAASVDLTSPYGRARVTTGSGTGGFMGKAWDAALPPVEVWAEALRVAKPGAHLVAFGGTRTFHRLACAIEDAGWEIRDTLMWLYGSGFPKSRDVSKAMDKQRNDNPDVAAVATYLRDALARSGKRRGEIDAHFGSANIGQYWFSPERNAQVPAWDKWKWLKAWLGFGDEMDTDVWRLNGRKGTPGEAWGKREVVGLSPHSANRASNIGYGADMEDEGERVVTAPATDLARQWEGWGTALKPGWEPIVLARKPLAGTVAATVSQYGTGALNIDGCRIEGRKAGGSGQPPLQYGGQNHRPFHDTAEPREFDRSLGRWPANVVLDPEAAALLDAQSGERGGGFGVRGASTRVYGGGKGFTAATGEEVGYGDTGGASRFYYVAKASRREREAGLEGMPVENGVVQNGSGRRFNPICDRSGKRIQECDCGACEWSPETNPKVRNSHPTVKPLALMRWLCRLVTPPGGLVLDPFAGSGTTGCAAVLDGFGFLGIEREADYCAIAERRLAYWSRVARRYHRFLSHRATHPIERASARPADPAQADLFGGAA